MAIELDTDPVRLSVAITAYLLSIAVFVPISGWASDRFGGRTVFRAAIGVFALASIFCGLSQNALELTAARVLQGMGGAMMVPVGRLVLFRSVEKSKLIRTMAYLQVPAQLGPVLGPLLGGFITTYFSWRWIFLVNVPLGLIGMFLVTRYFDNPKEENPRPLDWTGFLLTGVSLSCILYGIEVIGRGKGEAEPALLLLGFGIVVGVLALRHLRRHAHPILDLSVFRIPTFRAGIGAGSVFRAGVGPLTFLLPLLLQVVFGMTAFASGLLTFATAVGAMSMKFTARPILQRFGFRRVMIVNAIISAGTVVMCAFFTSETPALLMFALLLIAGFFQSLQYTSTQALSYADVPHVQMSTASSIISMAQQMSRGFGIACAAGVLHLTLAWRGATELALSDFQIAFFSAGLIGLFGLAFSFPLEPHDGSEVSGHPMQPKGQANPAMTSD
jgi:EmrB/QacA subfamily drug resistance transporter